MNEKSLQQLQTLSRYFRQMDEMMMQFGYRDALMENGIYENALSMAVMRAGLLVARLRGPARDELDRGASLKGVVALAKDISKGRVEENLDRIWNWVENTQPKLEERLMEILEEEGGLPSFYG